MKLTKKIEESLKLLDKYDQAYYNGKPILSDTAYDLFKDKVYRELPTGHPRLSKVGHDPSSNWKKRKHIIFMGSQNKVDSEDMIKAWIKSIYNILGAKDGQIQFVLQPKIDGFSLETVYDKSNLVAAVTRGNGIVGEDVLNNAKLFRLLPNKLSINNSVAARGEGILYNDDFDAVQKETNNHYKNSRNAASGISRRLDGKFCSSIHFLAYDINAKVSTESEKIEVLNKLGFATPFTYKVATMDGVLKVYRSYKEGKRNELPYGIDGLVLKLDDLELQEQLGVSHNRPDGQIALKFESDQALTVLEKIDIQVGRTGKLTPVAILKPVDLMGSTVKKATLHNFAYIDSMMLGIGSEVTIEKKGDIIPQVVEVLTPGKTIKRPDRCPSCGKLVDFDGVNLWCHNEGCKEKEINRIVYWIRTLDLKNFKVRFIEKLWDMNKIKRVSDLYGLTFDDFTGIDGMGEKTIKAFFAAREKTSSMYLDKFITALGIPGCSTETSKLLVERFESWKAIRNASVSDLEAIPGLAEKSSVQILAGIEEISDMADELLEVINIKVHKKGALIGTSFCVTGSLEKYSRKEFKEVVEENGGVFKSNVVKGLDYLVTNTPNSSSSKNIKAAKLGVAVIDEIEFLRLIGISKEEDKHNKGNDLDESKLEYELIF